MAPQTHACYRHVFEYEALNRRQLRNDRAFRNHQNHTRTRLMHDSTHHSIRTCTSEVALMCTTYTCTTALHGDAAASDLGCCSAVTLVPRAEGSPRPALGHRSKNTRLQCQVYHTYTFCLAHMQKFDPAPHGRYTLSLVAMVGPIVVVYLHECLVGSPVRDPAPPYIHTACSLKPQHLTTA